MRPDPIRVAIDLETTGLRPEQDVIIEIGAVKFAGARILDTFQSFVSISTPLPYRIQRLTGITSANLRRAPQLSALIAPLRAFIGSAPLVGHSVAFDASFLRRVGLAQRNPLLDTYELAATLLPDLPSYTLASVAEALGVPSSVNHRALADADLARGVLLALLERLSALDTTALHQLDALPAPADWTPAPLLRAEVRERAERVKSSPFAVLLEAAQSAPDLGVGIDRSVVSMALALPEPDAPAESLAREAEAPATEGAASDASERDVALADWMRAGGPLLLEVERTEAALLATLTSVARAAARPGEQIIIAASDGDEMKRVARALLPRALARAGLNATQMPIAELDEREAYLCAHRWFGVAREALGQSLSAEVVRGLAKLTVWSRETRTGLRADVALSGAEGDAWMRARSGPEFAELDADCPYRAAGYCFVERAERGARTATLLVTTHAALAARLTGRDTLLPDAARVVILDGRQIEDEARRQQTFTLNGAEALALLDTLAYGAGGEVGLLPLAATLTGEPARAAEWRGAVERAREAVRGACAALRAVQQEGQERGSRAGPTRGESFEHGALRVDDAVRASESWAALIRAWQECCAALAQVAIAARVAAEALQGGEPSPRAGGARADLLGLAWRLNLLAARGAEVIDGARTDDMVCWLRAPQAFPWSDPTRDRKNGHNGSNGQNGQNGQNGSNGQSGASDPDAAPARELDAQERLLAETPALVVAPIRMGALLEPLWRDGRGVAVIGWALAVDHEFEHVRGALGLPETTPAYALSPDYSSQTLLALPEDAPEPSAPGFHAQLEALVVALSRALDGDVVVIFPSHAALRTAANGIRRTLERDDILTLAQGMDGSARQLWQTFTAQPRTTLLGAGAFWDGAELRYRAPACVVVARTPFPPQSDPLVAARADVWPDPQAQYMVPQAALKLRQALGGLAWSHARRNAVILYDHRLQSRGYGEPILATLPRCAIRTRPLADLVELVAEWTHG